VSESSSHEDFGIRTASPLSESLTSTSYSISNEDVEEDVGGDVEYYEVEDLFTFEKIDKPTL
jgi:hypothetical protein